MVLATLPPALQSAGQPSSGEPSIFGRLSRLPAFRPATRNLLTISLESESAVSDFESAFSMDAALAADLLGLANSPLFGLRTQVLTIRHAIAMLGLETVRSLALTITMTSYWQKARWNDAIRGPWRHSVATAVIAEALGAADTTRGPLLYTGGLMHDIGRLALFQISPAKYQQILATEFASTQEYLTRENLLFDCGHDDAGAFLAMAWGFPIPLCDCIRFHHWEIAAHAGQLFELVGTACRLADALGYPEVRRADVDQSENAIATLLPPRLRGMAQLNPDTLRFKVEAQFAALSPKPSAGTN